MQPDDGALGTGQTRRRGPAGVGDAHGRGVGGTSGRGSRRSEVGARTRLSPIAGPVLTRAKSTDCIFRVGPDAPAPRPNWLS